MTSDIYRELAQHLDNLPGGFPATESGVELRILRRLFTPDEAHLALNMVLLPEEAQVIAHRAGVAPEIAAEQLQVMERKGLIYAIHRDGKPPRYMAIQFVVGIYEFQVNKLYPELVEDLEEYLQQVFDPEVWQTNPQLRAIPVGASVDARLEVLPYEQAENLMQGHDLFSVAPCICRQAQHTLDQGCDKPLETCLGFGQAAEYYLRNGLGRQISREEALQILKQAERAGLVLQPGNSRQTSFICTCCGCCCGVLKNVKRHPQPASIVSSSFRATLDRDTCNGCELCADRCQMDALALGDDGVMMLDADRCIGCGLCVTTCPTESLSLVRKPDDEQPYVPRNMIEASLRLGRARGKLGNRRLAGMVLKSTRDRVMSRQSEP